MAVELDAKTAPTPANVPPDSGNQGGAAAGSATVDPLASIAPEVLAALEARIAKANQAEIDRRVGKFVQENKELKEALEKAELEKMTEKQKQDYEIQKREKALQERENQILAEQAKYLKTKAIADAGLSTDVAEFVTGTTETEILASVAKLKAIFDAQRKAGVDTALKGAAGAPAQSQGNTPTGLDKLNSDLAEAKKRGDTMAAARILRAIEEIRTKKT